MQGGRQSSAPLDSSVLTLVTLTQSVMRHALEPSSDRVMTMLNALAQVRTVATLWLTQPSRCQNHGCGR